MEDFELGPNQQAWVDALRANPDMQMKQELGNVNKQKFCCLGMLCNLELQKLVNETSDDAFGLKVNTDGRIEGFVEEYTNCYDEDDTELYKDYDEFLPVALAERYHFYNREGELKESVTVDLDPTKDHDQIATATYSSLSGMNDGVFTWPRIADYIEANPSNVFSAPY